MRVKQLILFFSLIFINDISCQIPVNEVYSLINNESIHRNDVNWDKISSSFNQHLRQCKIDIDTIKAIVEIFESLNDYHSQINYQGKQYANFPQFDDTTLQKLIPLVQLSQSFSGKINSKKLENNIGYIFIPEILTWNEGIDQYAQLISDKICELAEAKVSGYIVDLRLNGGGQLSSMLAGLNLLLGENYLGGGINYKNEEIYTLKIRNNNLEINGNSITHIANKCNVNLDSIPVVILTSPVTRSSGTTVAISFKGRSNTYFLGEPTANGYTTGNNYYTFGNNFSINLAVTNSLDRNKTIYKTCLFPDLISKNGSDYLIIENDKTIQLACNMIMNKGN